MANEKSETNWKIEADSPVFLSPSELRLKRRARPGLIPIAIDNGRARLIWQDFERYHPYESFFHRSLDAFRALKAGVVVRFETDLSVLGQDWFEEEAIYPTGLIFHAGRCGSTALVRALASVRENLVLSEPAVLTHVLDEFARGEQQLLFYRNLILAMCRRRLASHRRACIKFPPHLVLSFGFLRAAFPDVPAISRKRDPAAIAQSFLRDLPEWKTNDGLDGYERYARNLIYQAEAADPRSLRHFDHGTVTAESIEGLIAHFGYTPSLRDLARMRHDIAAQFFRGLDAAL